ncbi:MAG: hypothetical protein AB7O97_03090 [Planctomycetota bacterium]
MNPFTSVTAIVLAALAVVPTTAFLVVWGNRRERARQRRHELIEQALRNPNLTPEVQRQLVQALQPPPRRGAFTLAWFGVFLGVTWLCFEPRGEEFVAAVLTTVGSFALLTLPFALRELEARKV